MTSTLTAQTNRPRIYVACLAAYNNGKLHGAWVDATLGEWSIWDGIQAMLATSPIAGAEEYAIHDYEGFESVRIGEYTGISEVAQIAAFIADHSRLGAMLLNEMGGDIDEAREAMNERYLGCHASLADYVQELTEDTTAIPTSLQYYIDWQAMARDAAMGGDIFTIETAHDQVHVFAGC